MEFYLLAVAFFVIALVYSSVGFGGGSSYLALLAQPLFGLLPDLIRPTALFCNIVVVIGSTIVYHRAGQLDVRKSWPLVAASVPAAFLGGYFPVPARAFFILLGMSLLAASALLWWKVRPVKSPERFRRPAFNFMLGGGIGFLSGLVGIGGGIFLSPVLHLVSWDEAKKISALAGFFILVNSVSGLAGQLIQGATFNFSFLWPLLLAVLVGGQVGSRLGARVFNAVVIKRITALLILAAGINILRNHL